MWGKTVGAGAHLVTLLAFVHWIRSVGSQTLCFSQSRYEWMSTPMSWTDASTSCTGLGGYLVRIQSAEEQAFIAVTFNTSDSWIGLSDRIRENRFVWLDGSSLGYTNWAGGEPRRGGAHDCVLWRDRSNDWSVERCDERDLEQFICEFDYSPGWFSCGSAEYRLLRSASSWVSAELSCQAEGGHLAKMETFDDAACVTTAIDTCSSTSQVWVGLSTVLSSEDYRWSSDLTATRIFAFSQNPPPLCLVTQQRVRPAGQEQQPPFAFVFNDCDILHEYVCRRLPARPQPFQHVCGAITATYTTLAFSWQQASQSCIDRGSQLLRSADSTHRSCAMDLLQTQGMRSLNSNLSGIPVWVSCQPPLCQPTTTCPVATLNGSAAPNQLIACSSPRPYVCIAETVIPTTLPSTPTPGPTTGTEIRATNDVTSTTMTSPDASGSIPASEPTAQNVTDENATDTSQTDSERNTTDELANSPTAFTSSQPVALTLGQVAGSSSDVGPIVGGAIGGLALLIIVIILVVLYRKRAKQGSFSLPAKTPTTVPVSAANPVYGMYMDHQTNNQNNITNRRHDGIYQNGDNSMLKVPVRESMVSSSSSRVPSEYLVPSDKENRNSAVFAEDWAKQQSTADVAYDDVVVNLDFDHEPIDDLHYDDVEVDVKHAS